MGGIRSLMSFFFQELVNGLTVGALYSLVALGFSMVYGVLKLLNFAHGDLYMVGAFTGYFVIQWFGGPKALSIPVPLLLVIMFVLAALLTGGLGVAIERFAYRPLRNAPRIAPLITAIGISFFLENAALLLFGGQYRVYNTPDFISFSSGIQIGSVNIDAVQIMVIVLGLALMVGLRVLVVRTRLGKQMRAVAADREAAEMLGINVNLTIAATFFLGSALAGVAGVMAGLLFNQVTNYDRLPGRPQGVHRGRRRRHRIDSRRDARRPADRDRRVLHHRLRLLDVHQPARLRAADRGHAGPAERPARPGPAAEGVSQPVSLDSPPPAAGPQVGADEWVARQEHRREYLPSWLGTAQRASERLGWWPRLALAGLAGLALPLIGLGGFQLQVGIDSLVVALLAVGLNIVVGWAGILDLGYIAFMGIGAYGFALLSSAQIGSAGHPPVGRGVDPDRDDRGRDHGPGRRLAVAAAARRLPGDRHALLRRGVRRVHQQRGAPARSAVPTGYQGSIRSGPSGSR